MKLLVALIFISFTASGKSILDTTDYWHIFYNQKVIAKYPVWPKNPPLIIAKANIRPSDSLTVKYWNDAPCSNCKTIIYFLDSKEKRILLAHGNGSWTPLKISVAALIKIAVVYGNKLDLYFRDDMGRGSKIFTLKIK